MTQEQPANKTTAVELYQTAVAAEAAAVATSENAVDIYLHTLDQQAPDGVVQSADGGSTSAFKRARLARKAARDAKTQAVQAGADTRELEQIEHHVETTVES